jgi:hypothetical protein
MPWFELSPFWRVFFWQDQEDMALEPGVIWCPWQCASHEDGLHLGLGSLLESFMRGWPSRLPWGRW